MGALKIKKQLIIGWREMVGLPDIGLPSLKAKIDTGARTTALHAVNLKPFKKDNTDWIAFDVPVAGQPRFRHEAPIADRRAIKNTSGIPEERFVIELTLVLGHRHWVIDVSLADREKMLFDMILGRTAIRRHGVLVDAGRSFLAGPPSWVPKNLHNRALRKI